MTETTVNEYRLPLAGVAASDEALGLSPVQPAAIAQIEGADVGHVRASLQANDAIVPCGPLRYLVVSEVTRAPALLVRLREGCPDADAVDLSHGWCRIRVIHARASGVLESGTWLDLESASRNGTASMPGAFRGIPVVLHVEATDRIAVYVPRSYARCLWDWLVDTVHGFERD
ncbi:hypothetical protein [Arhodomonas sp. AD133]|uniref:hypothetical protein n=1 Tax=Arhodomonas sp. AD133 TaxID=3415009 RepID=UPI003EC09D30